MLFAEHKKIPLEQQVIPLKSTPNYYDDEVTDLKNWTIRNENLDEKKFQILKKMIEQKRYGYVEITRTISPKDVTLKFCRKITHICKWECFVCITWKKIGE